MCAKSLKPKYETNSINNCQIFLHQWERMKGPNLFQELEIDHNLNNGVDKWFRTPIRSIRSEGNCCYQIK